MSKNPNLYDLQEICSYFNLSEATIRRRIRETRAGEGCFPLPLFPAGQRLVWRKVDVESWRGADGEVITYTPVITSQSPQIVPSPSDTEANARLMALGVNLK